MKKLQIKTRKGENDPKFSENIDFATVFFRSADDRIEVKNSEIINIDVYENGTLIFSGDKYDFYEQLKK
jgi:hypothetical protein